ncbi:single-stranded DNA-binding protein [Candidatus Microgenomates bacterium]|nr:single-stranded DNA-binding protein [Candidatus Microgenomates bacterium]
MASRSLNRVQLIGNLTRDPELRYTPQGTAVCTFGLATNRSWTTDGGEKKEETEFHRIVAWNKLAELCSQLLTKGRKIYVEGRLSTRSWTGQDGGQRTTTEVVIDDMILLDSRRPVEEAAPQVETASVGEEVGETDSLASNTPSNLGSSKSQGKGSKGKKNAEEAEKEEGGEEKIDPDDIPF